MSKRFGTAKQQPRKKTGGKKKKKPQPQWYDDYLEFFHEDTEEVEELDTHIVEGRELLKDIRRKMGRKPDHWASQAFGCPIRAVNDWRGVKPTNGEGLTTYKIFKRGDDEETALTERYQAEGSVIGTSYPVWIKHPDLKYIISGIVDVVLLKDGEIVPVEVKSAKDFNEMFGGYHGWKKYLPKQDHSAQLHVYLKAMGLPYGKLHYLNKNRQLDARYHVDFSEEFFDDIIAFFKSIEDLLAHDKDALKILDVTEYFKLGAWGRKRTFPCVWYSPAKDMKKMVGCCPYYDRCKKAYKKVKE
jgi:hypothetical protein